LGETAPQAAWPCHDLIEAKSARQERFIVRTLRGLLVSVITLLLGSQAGGQELPKVRVVFPTPPIVAFLPHIVAEQQGWFKRAGLTVEETFIMGDPNAVRALVSGTGDVTYVGAFTAYSGIAQGAAFKVIASEQPVPDFRFVAQDKFKTLKDLAGKRIAVSALGSMTQIMPQLMMQKHDIDTSNNSYVAVGDINARLQTVLADRADATLIDTMTYVRAKPAGGIDLVASVPEELPSVVFSYVIAKTTDIADPKMRHALELYIRYGVIEGSRFIMTNPDQAAEALKAKVPELDLTLIRSTIRSLNEANIWGINGGLSSQSAEDTIKLAKQAGAVNRDLTTAEVLDESLVNKIIAEVGRQ
jgi:NitT/TauT family transport system substrate-binding protein